MLSSTVITPRTAPRPADFLGGKNPNNSRLVSQGKRIQKSNLSLNYLNARGSFYMLFLLRIPKTFTIRRVENSFSKPACFSSAVVFVGRCDIFLPLGKFRS